MITRINISPSALRTVSSATGRVAKHAHKQLLDMVRNHGVIVLESSDAAKELVRFLKQHDDALPPGVRKKWMDLAIDFLKTNRMTTAKPALSLSPTTAQGFNSLSNAWSREIDVALVDPQAAETLGVPEDEGQMVSPETGFEVVIADVATNSYHFDAIKHLVAQGSLGQGESRELFWKDVLEPLWSVSRNAVVLDRYLFSGFLEKGWKDEHVQWLSRKLAHARGPVGKLTLIGQDFRPSETKFQRACDNLLRLATEGRLHSIDLVLVPPDNWKPRDYPHDRHIRFDSGAIMPLAGFDRLSRPKISHSEGMNWKFLLSSNSGALQESERKGRSEARVTVIELMYR